MNVATLGSEHAAGAGGTDGIPASRAGSGLTVAELTGVLDVTPGIIGYWDCGLRNVFANRAYVEFFGRSRDQMAGVHISEILEPEDYAVRLPYMQAALAGSAQQFDRTLIDSAGRVRHVQTSYLPDISNGVVRGMYACSLDITARKEQELQLIAERSRLHDAEAVGALGSWEMDVPTRAMTFSIGFLALYGLNEVAFSGDFRDVLACVVPEDRAELHASVEACINAKEPMQIRYRVIRPNDAQERWMDCRAQATDRDGRPARLMGVVADITDRVVAEQEAATWHAAQRAAAQLGQQYQALLTTVVEGVVLQDSTGAIVQANPAASAILGLSTDELTGLTSMDLRWHAVDEQGEPLPGERHPAMVALREGVPVRDVTFGICKPGGDVSWIKVSSAPLFDTEGQVEGVISGFADITAQRHAESALADSQEQFRLAFETAPIGMAMIDLSPSSRGRLLEVNPAMLRLTARSAATLQTLSLASLCSSEDAFGVRAMIHRLRSRDEETASLEVQLVRPGSTVWGQVTMSVVPASEMRPAHAICLIEDITLRKQNEQRLAHQSLHDPLTGLANRRLLKDRIKHALAVSARSNLPVGVLYLDLDGFKQVNDTAGHSAGDALLSQVARRLENAVRPGDTVARLGGDEFAILGVELADLDTLRAIASRCLESLRLPFRLESGTYVISASIGIRLSDADSDPDQLLAEADTAMYDAKRNGKNQMSLLSA